jgi:hypothetical protein
MTSDEYKKAAADYKAYGGQDYLDSVLEKIKKSLGDKYAKDSDLTQTKEYKEALEQQRLAREN